MFSFYNFVKTLFFDENISLIISDINYLYLYVYRVFSEIEKRFYEKTRKKFRILITKQKIRFWLKTAFR